MKNTAFTIVELLIVVVIIAILASITVVAYNGVTNQANDASVEVDLRNLGQMLITNTIETGEFPVDETGLSTAHLKVSKNAYGNHLISGGMEYNLLYCSTIAGYQPAGFAFVASAKSNKVYSFTSARGSVVQYPSGSWAEGWGTVCPDVLDVDAGNSNVGVWLYENSIWKSWLP